MSLNNTFFKALLIGALSAAVTGHVDRQWLMQMHHAQVELTRIDWGRGGRSGLAGGFDGLSLGRYPG